MFEEGAVQKVGYDETGVRETQRKMAIKIAEDLCSESARDAMKIDVYVHFVAELGGRQLV